MINTTIHIGASLLGGAHLGKSPFDRIYLGSTLIYQNISKLATPQNVAITGSEASWDFVDNATAYDVVINGATFGTVDSNAGNYDYMQDETTGELTVLSASYEKDGNALTIV